MNPSDDYQQTSMQQQQISNPGPRTRYTTWPAYPNAGAAPGRAVPYESSQQPGSISYGAASPPDSMMEQPYASENVFLMPMTQQEFLTRCMRFLEKAVKAWSRPELEKPLSALREALSEDVQESFVLKSMCPSGSHSSSPRASEPLQPVVRRSGSVDQHLSTSDAQRVSYTSQPITPPISTGPVDSESDFPDVPSLVMMSQGTQAPDMLQSMSSADQLGWNPTSIFEQVTNSLAGDLPVQWNTTFSTPTHSQANPLNGSTSGATEAPPIVDIHAVQTSLATGVQQLSPQQCSTTLVPNSVTPAMWQESVASVYKGGTKRRWHERG
ncbi:hypothetical protein CEP54_015100 [Fusarium duplospermum]|uniref:Uncharacterized protein n=1 Tax=Fusarium duplospermum TaxID=1325734 RepID=A0A428NRN0_9HYPO|nr:hypothetical protein CEP54_015100 [Fusarium duplospermum]